jgi:hypothetical protein
MLISGYKLHPLYGCQSHGMDCGRQTAGPSPLRQAQGQDNNFMEWDALCVAYAGEVKGLGYATIDKGVAGLRLRRTSHFADRSAPLRTTIFCLAKDDEQTETIHVSGCVSDRYVYTIVGRGNHGQKGTCATLVRNGTVPVCNRAGGRFLSPWRDHGAALQRAPAPQRANLSLLIYRRPVVLFCRCRTPFCVPVEFPKWGYRQATQRL